MSTRVHRIRLAGPWEVAGPFSGSDPAEICWRRVNVPATWRELFGDAPGTAFFRRAFNKPTNLTPGDRVLLEIPEGTGRLLAAEINGQDLPSPQTQAKRLEITRLLGEFNRVVLTFEYHPANEDRPAGGLWKPVVLAIESVESTQG